MAREPEWEGRRTGKLEVAGSIPSGRRPRRDGAETQKSGFCPTLKLTILRVWGMENAITALGWSRYGVILKNVYITTLCRSGLCGSSPLKLWYFARSKVFEKCRVGVDKLRFSKMSGSIFPRSGQSRLAFVATHFIKILMFAKFRFPRIFRILLYRGRRHERSH